MNREPLAIRAAAIWAAQSLILATDHHSKYVDRYAEHNEEDVDG